MRRFAGGILMLLAAACGDDPVTPTAADVAGIRFEVRVDTLELGMSAIAEAEAITRRNRVVPDIPLTWSSSHPDIVRVNASGELQALRPGYASIRASFGSVAADSFPLIVTTDSCFLQELVRQLHGFWGTFIQSGFTRNAETASGSTEYYGVPAFWGSGFAFSTGPDTVVLGYDYSSSSSDFKSGVCTLSADPLHTAALLRPDPRRNAPMPAGLVIVQDQYAYYDVPNRDYLLFRYTFTNTRPTPVTDLRAGAVADFDLYVPETNVGSFDETLQAAVAVSKDSLTNRITGGMALADGVVVSYRGPPAGQVPERTEYHDLLSAGIVNPGPSQAQDVRQVLGLAPVTLGAGETWSFWYILAAGADRAGFEAALAAARAKIAVIE